jgi:hypothetical protein
MVAPRIGAHADMRMGWAGFVTSAIRDLAGAERGQVLEREVAGPTRISDRFARRVNTHDYDTPEVLARWSGT